MRAIIFLSLVAAAFGFYIEPEVFGENQIETFAFENIINGSFEAVRKLMPDSVKVNNLTTKIPKGQGPLDGSITLDDFSLSGLKDFRITRLNLGLVGLLLNFTVEIPSLNLNGFYDANTTIGNLIPTYGKGRLNVNLKKLQIVGSANAALAIPKIHVKNTNVQLAIGQATFDVHGLLNNEPFSLIVSSILNDIVDRFINEHQALITKILSPVIENVINSILDPTPAPKP